jgi:hypothetical protein
MITPYQPIPAGKAKTPTDLVFVLQYVSESIFLVDWNLPRAT